MSDQATTAHVMRRAVPGDTRCADCGMTAGTKAHREGRAAQSPAATAPVTAPAAVPAVDQAEAPAPATVPAVPAGRALCGITLAGFSAHSRRPAECRLCGRPRTDHTEAPAVAGDQADTVPASAGDQADKITTGGNDMLRFTIDRVTLVNALAFVMMAVPKRPAVPVLTGVVFDATAGGLRIRAFDYEVSTVADVPADVAGDGTALMGAVTLAAWIKALPKSATSLTFTQTDGCTVRVSAGNAYTDVALMPVEDYPTAPDMPAGLGTVSLATLAGAVAGATVAAGTDETLPMMTGVKLRAAGSTLSADATDRYRLASVDVPWSPAGAGNDWEALIPAGTLADYVKAMRKVAGRKLPGTVTVGVLAHGATDATFGVQYAAGDGAYYALSSRLLDGANYPPVRSLYPSATGTTVTVDATALAGMVKRVTAGAGAKTDPAIVTFDAAGTITAEYGFRDDGSPANVETMTGADVSGDTITVGFNGPYLIDALAVAGAGMVRIDTQVDPRKPVVMRPAGDQEIGHDARHLIMPIRLDRAAPAPAVKAEAPEAHAYVAAIGERRCGVAGCDKGRTAKIHTVPAVDQASDQAEAPAVDQADTVPAAVPAATAPEAPAATVDQADTVPAAVPAATAPASDQAEAPATVPAVDQADTVAPAVRALIAAGTWNVETVGRGSARRAASVMRLPRTAGKLDRDTYTAVRDALAAIGGGSWDRTVKGFAFPSGDSGNPWRAATKSGHERVSDWLAATAGDQAESDQADTVAPAPATVPAVDQADARPAVSDDERNRRRLAAAVTRQTPAGTRSRVAIIGDAIHVTAVRPAESLVSDYMGRAYRFERGIPSAMGAPSFRYVPVVPALAGDQADTVPAGDVDQAESDQADTVAPALADGRAVARIATRPVTGGDRAARILPAGALAAVPATPRPADFDAYRAEIRGCECELCTDLAYVRPLDFNGSEKLHAARVLLAALRAGTHSHVTMAENVAGAKAAKAATLAEETARGASAERIATIERGYSVARMSDFYGSGIGIGMTPATAPASVPAVDQAEAVTVRQRAADVDQPAPAIVASVPDSAPAATAPAVDQAESDQADTVAPEAPAAPVDQADTVPAATAPVTAPAVRLIYAAPATRPAVDQAEAPAVDQAESVPAGDTYGAHAAMIDVAGIGTLAGYRFHVAKGTATRALAKEVKSMLGKERATVGASFYVPAPAGKRTISVVPAPGHSVPDWSTVLRLVAGMIGDALAGDACECDQAHALAE